MSAPETHLEKQKRRHGPVFIMFAVAIGLVILAALGSGLWIEDGSDIHNEPAVIDPMAEEAPSDG